MAEHCFDNRNFKGVIDFGENTVQSTDKKQFQESMNDCTGHHDIAEIMFNIG